MSPRSSATLVDAEPEVVGSLSEVPGAEEMFGEDAGEDVPGAHR